MYKVYKPKLAFLNIYNLSKYLSKETQTAFEMPLMAK